MFTIGHFSRFNAARAPGKPAVILGDRVLTYSDLDALSNSVGRLLMAHGVAPGDRVGVLSFNTPEYVVLIQAVAKIGAILVPFNMRHSVEEIAYQLSESSPRVAFVEQSAASLLADASAAAQCSAEQMVIEQCIVFDGSWRARDGSYGAEPIETIVDPRSAAVIMYTSGSTGLPKGVTTSHENYIRIFTAIAIEFDLRGDDVVQAVMPFFHNGGFASVLCPALMMGATIVCGHGPFNAAQVLEDVQRYRITVTHWIATMIDRVVEELESHEVNVSSLRSVHYGAMPTPPGLLERAKRVLDVDFYQGYGSTDAGMIGCLSPQGHEDRKGSTARTVFNTLMRIVDDCGMDVGDGDVGEIVIYAATSGMMKYWNNPEATRQTLRDGWIYTGDMARKDGDGYFTLVDRRDFLIISGGENIAPAELEAIMSSHSAIREVAVIGVPDEKFGQQVCAVVALREGCDLDLEALRDFCAAHVARYKLPRKLVLVDALPRTGPGKIARSKLKALAESAA